MPKLQARFEKMIDARRALNQLRDNGFKNAYVDMAGEGLNEFAEEINPAGTTKAPSLSALVLNGSSHLTDASKAPLAAANPMVSGIGSYNELAENSAARLVIDIDEEHEEKIRDLLRQSGGTV